MRFTVVCLPKADDEVATLWMAAEVRSSVSVAADKIDELLKRDPRGVGESRDGGRRILLVLAIGSDLLD